MKNNTQDIQTLFKNTLNSLSAADMVEIDADVLAMHFIGLVDEVMEERSMSKKELAVRVGTSPSFVTQVFRGNRRPSWDFLAKIQRALDMRFEISTKEKHEQWLSDELYDYHAKWERSRNLYGKMKAAPTHGILAIEEEHDYALAG